jgi:hypothetical protein
LFDVARPSILLALPVLLMMSFLTFRWGMTLAFAKLMALALLVSPKDEHSKVGMSLLFAAVNGEGKELCNDDGDGNSDLIGVDVKEEEAEVDGD